MSQRSLREIFRWPMGLALSSLIGLVAALVADGFGDVVGWVLLGVPALVALVFWQRRQPSRNGDKVARL